MVVSFIIGMILYFTVVCTMKSCVNESGAFQLPLNGLIIPFKYLIMNKDYKKFNQLFFSLNNPFLYIITSILVMTFLILKYFKTRKISKQVTLEDIES